VIHMARQTRDPGRDKFMFSSKWGQQWEASRNAQEARELLRRIVPEPAADEAEPPSGGESGACFRRVMALLGKRGGR